MAEDIRNLMFVFEDCKNIDDRGVRELLKEISNEDLTLALRGASDDLKEKFFKNMSERAGNMIREEHGAHQTFRRGNRSAEYRQNCAPPGSRKQGGGQPGSGRGFCLEVTA